MSCCGGMGAAAVQERGRALVDEAAARGALVKLVYTGTDVRTRAYVAEGRPYFFGVNKPVNAVPARVVPQFLDPQGRYFGNFELYEVSVVASPEPGVLSPASLGQGAPEPKSMLAADGEQAETSTDAPAAGGRKRGKDAG